MIKWLVRNGFLPQDLVPEYSVHVAERKTEIHGLTVKDLTEEEKAEIIRNIPKQVRVHPSYYEEWTEEL